MKADIYEHTPVQDEQTGAIIKSWSKLETVDCLAKSIVSDTLRADSSSIDLKNYLINISNIIKIRTNKPINSGCRVTNIRNSDGVIWSESTTVPSEGGYEGTTIFEPRGTSPIMDFNGKVIEYEVILQRQEIQRLDV
jgi:hypothetical protein